MKLCPNCGCQMADDALFCPICGTAVNSEPIPYIPPVPYVDPYNHTEKFDPADIANTKLLCMLVYLVDFMGVILALLAAKESAYVGFHIRQSLKFTVIEILMVLATLLLCWTVIVPILALIAFIVLLVIKFVSFTQVCGGKAKEPVIIRSIPFLK